MILRQLDKWILTHDPSVQRIRGERIERARAVFLVLGPVRALTGLGTVPPDAAALATAAAHQKSRRGEVKRSLAAVATKAPAEALPILSQAGPALNFCHILYWTDELR